MTGMGRVRRAYRRVWFTCVGANFAVVAAFVVGSISWNYALFPDVPTARFLTAVAIAGSVYFAFAATLVYLSVKRIVIRATLWFVEGHEASEADQRALAGIPQFIAKLCAGVWIAAIPFGIWTLTRFVDFEITLFDTAKTIFAWTMLGFAASMLSYLLAERALRHERAAALDGGWLPPGPGAMGMRTRLLLAWLGAAALPLLAIAMFFVNSTAEQRANSAWVVWLTVVIGTVAGFLVTLFASRTIIEPIHTIRRGMQAVAQGHLDHEIDVDDASELGLLQSGFNQMVDGLKERERMREIFGHHVGTDVAARALAGITGLGGERRHATAMFVDIIGSTALTHRNDADDVVAILNAFFDTIVRAIGTHGGMVNKFQGDGALCVFGVPHEQPDHAVRALRAARTLHADLRLMRVEAAIGVSSGEVVAGNVGTADRYEYTVIGDAVNEASRLCDVAKTSSVRVLASSATITLSGESSAWYEVGRYNLRGRSAETIAYSLT